jgi:hypothetical protein
LQNPSLTPVFAECEAADKMAIKSKALGIWGQAIVIKD